MSGHLRRIIGPTRKRLLDILQQVQAKEHFRVDSGLPENEQITQVRHKISDLETLIARLKGAVAILEDKHNEWAKLLASLGGEALQKEEAAYENFDKPQPDTSLKSCWKERMSSLVWRFDSKNYITWRCCWNSLHNPILRIVVNMFLRLTFIMRL